jgi:hypothetical protein
VDGRRAWWIVFIHSPSRKRAPGQPSIPPATIITCPCPYILIALQPARTLYTYIYTHSHYKSCVCLCRHGVVPTIFLPALIVKNDFFRIRLFPSAFKEFIELWFIILLARSLALSLPLVNNKQSEFAPVMIRYEQ